MSTFRAVHAAINLAVATILLAIILRTWLVAGLVEPVTVTGSSMAPTLRGPFASIPCPRCHESFDVGAEFIVGTAHVDCPRCAAQFVAQAALPVERGDRLWIDRTAFSWRKPHRWEVVVAHCPDDGGQMCVKRVVGLPGETIRISQGDVWVDGCLLTKSLAEQLILRQLVYRAGGVLPRWTSQDDEAWQWQQGRWRCAADDSQGEHWLRYVHLDEKPITDDSTYNAGVSRTLNLVRDFMLSAHLRLRGTGTLALESNDGRRTLRVTIRPVDGSITIDEGGQNLKRGFLSAEVQDRLLQDEVQLVLSNFDRQLLLALNGRVELRYLLADNSSPVGTESPFAVGALGLDVELSELILYRDVYYGTQPVAERASRRGTTIRLGEAAYFLLGDNGPISLDSRTWGPLPGRLLLGRPVGVR